MNSILKCKELYIFPHHAADVSRQNWLNKQVRNFLQVYSALSIIFVLSGINGVLSSYNSVIVMRLPGPVSPSLKDLLSWPCCAFVSPQSLTVIDLNGNPRIRKAWERLTCKSPIHGHFSFLSLLHIKRSPSSALYSRSPYLAGLNLWSSKQHFSVEPPTLAKLGIGFPRVNLTVY